MHAVATPSRPDRVDAAEPEARSGAARLRVFAAVVLGPLFTGYAAVAAVLALVTAVASRSEFSTVGVLLAAGPSWLALYQVPLEIEGQPLGVLPVLPTVGAVALVARTCASAAQRLGYREPAQAVTLICLTAAAHGVFGAAFSLLPSGELSAEPLSAFLVPALLAGVAAGLGLTRQCSLVSGLRRYLDPAALHGLRAGALGLSGLLAAGALTFVVATGLSAPTVHELFVGNAPGFGSGLGMLLLSLGYVPNAVVGALGFATGAGVDIGSVSLSPFTLAGGDVPGLPLLAGLPEEQANWWPVFLLLPAAVGALVGWSLRRADDRPLARLRMMGVAGVLVGFAVVVLGTLSGGRLGGLPEPVGIEVAATSVAAFCWIALPGGLVAWFAGPRPSASAEATSTRDTQAEEAEEDSAVEWPAEDGDPEAEAAELDGDVEDRTGDGQEPDEAAEPDRPETGAAPVEPDTRCGDTDIHADTDADTDADADTDVEGGTGSREQSAVEPVEEPEAPVEPDSEVHPERPESEPESSEDSASREQHRAD